MRAAECAGYALPHTKIENEIRFAMINENSVSSHFPDSIPRRRTAWLTVKKYTDGIFTLLILCGCNYTAILPPLAHRC